MWVTRALASPGPRRSGGDCGEEAPGNAEEESGRGRMVHLPLEEERPRPPERGRSRPTPRGRRRRLRTAPALLQHRTVEIDLSEMPQATQADVPFGNPLHGVSIPLTWQGGGQRPPPHLWQGRKGWARPFGGETEVRLPADHPSNRIRLFPTGSHSIANRPRRVLETLRLATEAVPQLLRSRRTGQTYPPLRIRTALFGR